MDKNHNKIANIDDVLKIPLHKSIYHRLPWLVIGLFGGLFAAKIVKSFETTLESNIYLAAFIPLIVYMSDAVGTQMEAFAIRDFAIQSHMHFIKYFIRQLIIVTIMAIILSISIYSIDLLYLSHDPKVAMVLCFALFGAIMSSLFTGLLIPYIFKKIKLDPANASGPIATIIQDLMSVIIYFTIAQSILS